MRDASKVLKIFLQSAAECGILNELIEALRLSQGRKGKKMNTGFLIVAHKPLATAFYKVAKEIFVKLEDVEPIDIDSDAPRNEQLEQIKCAWERLETDQKMILLDVAGATPANVVKEFALTQNCCCLSPLSLPLLMKLICYRHCDMAALKLKAAQASAVEEFTDNEKH